MAKFCLKIGSINRKLIMPIIAAIIYIIMDVIEYNVTMPELHYIFDFYARGISYVLLKIIPIVQKCRNSPGIKEKKLHCKKTIFEVSIIYIIYIVFFGVIVYLNSLKSKDPDGTEDYKLSHYKGLCTEEAVEIVFIVIVSKFLLKMKLYIHHYIGLLIFLALSLIIDNVCSLSIFKPEIFFISMYMIYLILDSIYITYEKYMMDKLGYSPYNVVFFISFIFLFSATLGIIVLSFTGSMFYDGEKYLFEDMETYFKNNDYTEVILEIVYLIFFRFFVNVLKILTVYYFSQIHTFSIYILIKIFDLLLRKDSNYKYFSLLFFIFQFLGLLIFLEIIELNFWNLDKNTIRNIEARVSEEDKELLKDQEIEKDENEKVELSPGYLVETEMARVSENENNDEDNRKTVD